MRSAGPAAAAAMLAGAVAAAVLLVPPSATAQDFRLQGASVAPKRAAFDGPRRVAIGFRFAGPEPRDIAIRLRRRGRGIRTIVVRRAEPGRAHRVRWDGLNGRGRVAPAGRYAVLVGPAGGRLRVAGRFRFRDHVFPVRGRHWGRGPLGAFGAPRSGGRRHEGYDVMAACGTPVVAARGGKVVRRAYDHALDGHYVIVAGRRTRRTYRYSHLRRPARVRRGDVVRTGQRIGAVGKTGNARTTPCHLHFELRRRGRPIDPARHLRRWARQ